MRKSFTEGPVLKHLLSMLFASWVAMASGMLLSVADMYFLSRLNDVDVLAAIGFAGSVGMIPSSLGIGFSVAISVLVSQKISREGEKAAASLFSAIIFIAFLLSSAASVLIVIFLPDILSLLGAKGRVLDLAIRYLSLTLMSAPFGVLIMALAAGLRARALAKASMWVSLIATLVNLVLDPILIEVLAYGIEGAAWATIIARLCSVLLGLHFIVFRLNFIRLIGKRHIIDGFHQSKRIALPTLISNLCTPVGGMIVVSVVSGFGTQAMAGMAVVGSLSAILFSVYFSLTGAAGPMVGQNIGAGKPERVAAIYQAGLKILSLYTILVWVFLAFLYPYLVDFYQLTDVAANLLKLYCYLQIPLSLGLGLIALSNGIMNNLMKAKWPMWLNIIRSTIVTYLLCHAGSALFGVYGAVMASTISFVLFGLLSIYLAQSLFRQRFAPLHLFSAN